MSALLALSDNPRLFPSSVRFALGATPPRFSPTLDSFVIKSRFPSSCEIAYRSLNVKLWVCKYFSKLFLHAGKTFEKFLHILRQAENLTFISSLCGAELKKRRRGFASHETLFFIVGRFALGEIGLCYRVPGRKEKIDHSGWRKELPYEIVYKQERSPYTYFRY